MIIFILDTAPDMRTVSTALTLALLLCATLLLGGGRAHAARQAEPAAAVLHVGWFNAGGHYLLNYADASGMHQGLTPDTLRAVLAGRRIVPSYHHYDSYAAAEQALRSGEINVLLDMLWTPQRQRDFWLSAAYANLPVGVVQARSAASIDKLSALDGLRVAVIGDAWRDHLLQAAPQAQAVAVATPREGVLAVDEGRADAYLGFYFAGLTEVQRGGMGTLEAHQLALANRSVHFMARHDDKATIALLAGGLSAMTTQERNDIRVRWLDALQTASQHALAFSADERAWLEAHPVLKVGIPGFTSPYDYLDDEQNWHGPGAELLRRFSLSAGIRLEPILLSRYEAPHEALQRGVIDVTPSYTVGTGDGAILETKPYTHEPWGWVRKLDDTAAVRRVAAVTWRLRGIKTAPGLQEYDIVPVASTAEALAAIVAGRADAAYVNLFVANDLISQYYQGRLQVAAEQSGAEFLSFGLPAGNAVLRDMLNRAIARYRPGELERLAHGSRQTVLSVGYDKQSVWRTALLIACLVLVVLAGLGWTIHRIRAAGRAAELARKDAIAARQQAEAADRAKSVFLATMSHEIRTPMNGVIGVIDLLQDSGLDPQQRRYLNVAEQSARLLLRVLNDVLDYSKIEAGALTLEQAPFDMYMVADHIAVLFRPLAIEKELDFGVAVMPHFDRLVLGDAVRLTQVTANLVSNAIRFTAHGAVTVEMRNLLRHGRPHLQLRVSDSGCGMSPEFQQRLFTPFHQEERPGAASRSGTGLGLSIVKELADMMGGTVVVESAPGAGTTVLVMLPLTWGEAAPPWPSLAGRSAHVALDSPPLRRAVQAWTRKMGMAGAPAATATLQVSDAGSAGWLLAVPGQAPTTVFTRSDFVREAERLLGGLPARPRPKPKAPAPIALAADVLLCEDHDINRDIMARQLDKLGFVVRSAIDGEDGLRQWRQRQPRIVLADCQMPRLDGYGLARAIRAEEAKRGLPRTLIIAVSASASKSDGDNCLAAGMDDYLPKPMTRQMLADCLLRWGIAPVQQE